MEDLCDVQQADDVALLITYGLVGSGCCSACERATPTVALTRCLKCRWTMSCSASVALVVSRVTIGLRVMIVLTCVV